MKFWEPLPIQCPALLLLLISVIHNTDKYPRTNLSLAVKVVSNKATQGVLLFSLMPWSIIEKNQEYSAELQQHSFNNIPAASTLGSISANCGPVGLNILHIRINQNDFSGLEVLAATLWNLQFVCMKIKDMIGKIRTFFEKLDYLDVPQCALGILRHSIGDTK